ncbi:uncharacterized protein PV09_06493 [Verruconis gallopava]|uniref:DUF3429 domain-containing protein n=1 Tax=Verruconis gallopava TaxID=253628 RepID=A0A0D1YMI7_9PEZI|nr:uncharacterized protein PV09_06493 [Verruconis gallopava]KIW01982.1 hypothetical protein PV09_06493 [Verruconis gallopava]
MFRTQAPRGVFRSLSSLSNQAVVPRRRAPLLPSAQWSSGICTAASKRPQLWTALSKNTTQVYVRHQGKYDKPDLKHEAEVAKQKLKATPETVSTSSSIHPILHEQQTPSSGDKLHTHGSIRSDLQTIRETFNLSEVPREAYVLGLAGVIPYLATSLSTLGLAYEIKTAHDVGTGYLMKAETAEQLLNLLEPIQVGYGAVIISFLGAVHWGFEWAGYGGHKGYPRYAIGVAAPAIAWPSLLLPVQYSLIAQFLAFNFLYYADSRATRRGWAPPWYGTYRFVLTFIVGATIVLTLIGRGELIGRVDRSPGLAERARGIQMEMQAKFKAEEEAHRQQLIAQGEADDESVESLDELKDNDDSEEEKNEGGNKEGKQDEDEDQKKKSGKEKE